MVKLTHVRVIEDGIPVRDLTVGRVYEVLEDEVGQKKILDDVRDPRFVFSNAGKMFPHFEPCPAPAEDRVLTPEEAGFIESPLPEGFAPDDGVKKFDGGKAPIMQGCIGRFPLAIEQIARVSEYGQRKYGTYDGWEKLPDAANRYSDAMGRHIVLRRSEGEYDEKDSGLPHLAQVAWNVLATLELALREGVIQMSDGNQIEDGKPILHSNGRSNTPVTKQLDDLIRQV